MKHGNHKQPMRQDVIGLVSRAWQEIRPELLTHSFLVCGLLNAIDGTEDSLVSDKLPQVDKDGEEDEDEEEDSEDLDSNEDADERVSLCT